MKMKPMPLPFEDNQKAKPKIANPKAMCTTQILDSKNAQYLRHLYY
jgi:hypothetical protein